MCCNVCLSSDSIHFSYSSVKDIIKFYQSKVLVEVCLIRFGIMLMYQVFIYSKIENIQDCCFQHIYIYISVTTFIICLYCMAVPITHIWLPVVWEHICRTINKLEDKSFEETREYNAHNKTLCLHALEIPRTNVWYGYCRFLR